MRAHALRTAIRLLVLSGAGLVLMTGPGRVRGQSNPEIGPPLAEAQAVWKGFWTAVIVGDLKDARTYLHSQRRHLFPGPHRPEELQQMASQMAHCRLHPNPFAADLDEVIYRVLCEHRGETAESQVGLRRDRDGAWRLWLL